MQFWVIQTLNSLALGGLLFLLSCGFSLIFGLMRVANLAHGAFFMLGAYLGATLLGFGLPFLFRPDEEVVVFNTGAAQKYPEVVRLDLPRLDKDQPVDYEALAATLA